MGAPETINIISSCLDRHHDTCYAAIHELERVHEMRNAVELSTDLDVSMININMVVLLTHHRS